MFADSLSADGATTSAAIVLTYLASWIPPWGVATIAPIDA